MAIANNASAITVWKLKSSLSVDSSSQVTYPLSHFNQPSALVDGFFGLAYHQNNLFIAGYKNLIRKIPVSLDGNNMLVVSSEWTNLGEPSWNTASNNVYYLNNNIINNHLYVGQISKGVSIFDLSNWTTSGISSYINPLSTSGAKSALAIGEKIYFTGGDVEGILRMDNITGTNLTSYALGTNPGVESIVTDGTYIYTNDDVTRGLIHKYLPGGTGSTLTMTDMHPGTWVNPDIGGRVRGLSYDKGYIYASPGANGSNRKIYAINSKTGVATDLGISVPGTGQVYGAIVVNVEVANPTVPTNTQDQ